MPSEEIVEEVVETGTEEGAGEEVVTEDVTEIEPQSRFPESKTEDAGKDEKQASKAAVDDDEEIDPVYQKHLSKALADQEKRLTERFGKTSEVTQSVRDQLDVDNYIRENPDYGKYRSTMLKYLQHDAYKNVPVEVIAAYVSSKDQQAIGAAKERQAAAGAAATRGGGTTPRPATAGTKDWTTASRDDFNAEKNRVLGRGA